MWKSTGIPSLKSQILIYRWNFLVDVTRGRFSFLFYVKFRFLRKENIYYGKLRQGRFIAKCFFGLVFITPEGAYYCFKTFFPLKCFTRCFEP